MESAARPGEWTLLDASIAASSAATITASALQPSSLYRFRARSTNSRGSSAWTSASPWYRTESTRPPPPPPPSAEPVSPHECELRWAHMTAVAEYEVSDFKD